jgi:hypothetical protein
MYIIWYIIFLFVMLAATDDIRTEATIHRSSTEWKHGAPLVKGRDDAVHAINISNNCQATYTI